MISIRIVELLVERCKNKIVIPAKAGTHKPKVDSVSHSDCTQWDSEE